MRQLASLFQLALLGVLCLPVILTWSGGPPWWAWTLSGCGVVAWIFLMGARRRSRLAGEVAGGAADVAVDAILFTDGAEILVGGVSEIASAVGDVASGVMDAAGEIDL